MSRIRVSQLLVLVLPWPAVIFFYPLMHGMVAHLLWWMATQSGATRLSVANFSRETWLALAAFDGLLIGLIPLHDFRLWAASSMGLLNYRPKTLEAGRSWHPERWAWVLPTFTLVLRFITFDGHDQTSVLAVYVAGESRWSHFFATPPPISFDTLSLYSDLLYITSPALFLLGYAFAAWLRDQVSTHSLSERFQLIHSAPNSNSDEPTEKPAEHGPDN